MRHRKAHQHKKKHDSLAKDQTGPSYSGGQVARKNKLEIVLKCDTAGTLEAVVSAIQTVSTPVAVDIIHVGVGPVNKTDVMTAETGSRLIVGFDVDVIPKLELFYREKGVEIRLHDVIYKLVGDIKSIAASLVQHEDSETVLGSARVIALFKSSRKGIILGCEVQEGRLALGDAFRVISEMGPVYSGKIESLHIEKDAVNKATKGQQVGLKIRDFKEAKIGDLVESYRFVSEKGRQAWQPRGALFRL